MVRMTVVNFSSGSSHQTHQARPFLFHHFVHGHWLWMPSQPPLNIEVGRRKKSNDLGNKYKRPNIKNKKKGKRFLVWPKGVPFRGRPESHGPRPIHIKPLHERYVFYACGLFIVLRQWVHSNINIFGFLWFLLVGPFFGFFECLFSPLLATPVAGV